ncbi:mitochondrial amidoxime reducing component 2 [Hyposmocoma kahamanoa]|uniref:mitochondrial amidoxime reducing component 2 n=1 Tax=Hyposmocoma kahamanoa TaxID=1477025 RepID=UPI000E6D7E16|nr:mitochondrial amidoxime reducing component 2 [Hyposmocoma kahamanoa]
MSNQANYVAAAVATVGVLGGAYYAYQAYKAHQRHKIPKHWKQVGTLQHLFLYPVKSCGPAILNKAECSALGLRDGWLRDRVLVVVDSKNSFITARAHPELLQINPTVKSAILTLKHADYEPLHVNLAEVAATQKPQTAVVWGATVPVYDCGWEASEWVSRIVDNSTTNYRLMYYATEKSRKIREKPVVKFYNLTKYDTGAFPDETSYNLINHASVDDLNMRMKDAEASLLQFRPNFVLTGAKPYDEDNWKFLKIGDNIFEIIKPCTRCILTTIDPETGVPDENGEPVKTLRTYRLDENPEIRKAAHNSPRMGLQIALRSDPGGLVSLNDPIYAA